MGRSGSRVSARHSRGVSAPSAPQTAPTGASPSSAGRRLRLPLRGRRRNMHRYQAVRSNQSAVRDVRDHGSSAGEPPPRPRAAHAIGEHLMNATWDLADVQDWLRHRHISSAMILRPGHEPAPGSALQGHPAFARDRQDGGHERTHAFPHSRQIVFIRRSSRFAQAAVPSHHPPPHFLGLGYAGGREIPIPGTPKLRVQM